jgi:hypothetical protein
MKEKNSSINSQPKSNCSKLNDLELLNNLKELKQTLDQQDLQIKYFRREKNVMRFQANYWKNQHDELNRKRKIRCFQCLSRMKTNNLIKKAKSRFVKYNYNKVFNIF